VRFTFSTKTSTTSLRRHLGIQHREEYLQLAGQGRWKNQLLGNKAAATVNVAQFRTPFSQEAFLDYLVNFIIVDNQVSILLYGHIYQANFSLSQSMLSNVQNFVNFFYSCAQSYKTRTSPDKPK